MSTAATSPLSRAFEGDGPDPEGAARRPSAPLRADVGGVARRASRAAPGQDVLRRAVPVGVWSIVDGLVVDGVPVPETRDPVKALEAILDAQRQGLLPPEGLSDGRRGAPGDRPAPARPVPGAQGPRPPRAVRVAPPGHPRRGQEGDLRRRVRAARRQRDRKAPRGPPAPPARRRHRRGLDAAAGARDARPDGRRDRAPRLEGLRLAQDVRRDGVLRDPGGEGADVAQGGRARVRAAALLARRRRRLRRPEDLAAEAAGALLQGGPRRRDSDPQGPAPDGDLGLRQEPLRQDHLDALEPARSSAST